MNRSESVKDFPIIEAAAACTKRVETTNREVRRVRWPKNMCGNHGKKIRRGAWNFIVHSKQEKQGDFFLQFFGCYVTAIFYCRLLARQHRRTYHGDWETDLSYFWQSRINMYWSHGYPDCWKCTNLIIIEYMVMPFLSIHPRALRPLV